MAIVALPSKSGLQIKPNPVRSAGQISFVLSRDSDTNLRIYDVAGRLMRDFGKKRGSIGVNGVQWDGTDAFGKPVKSGIYFLRLTIAEGEQLAAKALVVR